VSHPLRIAQVSPLFESVPPTRYGGTERIVAYLTDALLDLGHEVTLYASGDSVTRAELVPCSEHALRLANTRPGMATCLHVLQVEEVVRNAREHQLVHFHTEPYQHAVARHLRMCALTTVHGRLDIPEAVRLYEEYDDQPLVSISRYQRRTLPRAAWAGNVYHGLPPDLYHLDERPRGYLAFLGRIAPEKRPDRAIEIARRAGLPLRIAAKVDDVDRGYYEEVIAPLIDGRDVELIGEVDDAGKQELLGGALGLLFPIDWPEPFGLVMIESLACGAPVIAWRAGSVPEVLRHGETGWIVDSVDEAVEAVQRIGELSRARCRESFLERFTAARMAADYVKIYRARIAQERALAA